MRRQIVLAMLALTALACSGSDGDLRASLQKTEKERDQLRARITRLEAEEEARRTYVAETTRLLNEVQDSIAAIRREELKIVRVAASAGPEGMVRDSQRREILQDIEDIRKALKEGDAKIGEILARSEDPLLREQVEHFQSQAAQLQRTLDEQRRDLATMVSTIRSLRQEIALKEGEILARDKVIVKKEEEITRYEEEARAGYLLVGTADELQNAGVAEYRRGVVGRKIWQIRKDLDKSRFRPIDTVQVREIPIAAPLRKVVVLSSHPASSYALEEDGAGSTVLRITEPGSFWQFDFVVVLVKR